MKYGKKYFHHSGNKYAEYAGIGKLVKLDIDLLFIWFIETAPVLRV